MIRRGKLVLDLDFLKRYEEELEAMNRGKEGLSFTPTNSHVRLLSTIRNLYSMPYRHQGGGHQPRPLLPLAQAFPRRLLWS